MKVRFLTICLLILLFSNTNKAAHAAHGPSQYSWYLDLKQNSVTVTPIQPVLPITNHDTAKISQVNVVSDIAVSDTASGLDQVHFSNNSVGWLPWIDFDSETYWLLSTANEYTPTTHAQARDLAGNVVQISDDIYLSSYPDLPASANYRLCNRVVNSGGGVSESTSYSLISSIGEAGVASSSSTSFDISAGFLAMLQGCQIPLPSNNYQLMQSVIASGGQGFRTSTSFIVHDTLGETFTTGATAMISSNYSLSSGFWSMPISSEFVPPVLRIDRGTTNEDLEISWDVSTLGATYELWRSTAPYFTPGDPLSFIVTTITPAVIGTTTVADNGALSVEDSVYYILKIVPGSGAELFSGRVGGSKIFITP